MGDVVDVQDDVIELQSEEDKGEKKRRHNPCSPSDLFQQSETARAKKNSDS